jgi:putative membrane protein
MFKIILKVLSNAGALYLAARFVNGITLSANLNNLTAVVPILILIGFVLWVGNSIIRPLLRLLTFPLIIVSFGLFNAIINILILWGVDIILPQIEIAGLVPLLWTTLIVWAVNSLLFFLD